MKFFLKRTTFLLTYILMMSVQGSRELIQENQKLQSKLFCEILNGIDEYIQIRKLENGIFGIKASDSTYSLTFNSTNQIQDYKNVLIIQANKELDINVDFNFPDYQIKNNYIDGFLYKQMKFIIDDGNHIYFNIITFSQASFKEFTLKDFGKISLRQKSEDSEAFFLQMIFITPQNVQTQTNNIISNFNQLNRICKINECKTDLLLQHFMEQIGILQIYPANILKAQFSKNQFLQDFNLHNNIFYAVVLSESEILQKIQTNSCDISKQDQILINNTTYQWHQEFCNNSHSYIYIIQTKKCLNTKKCENYIFSIESKNNYSPESLINHFAVLIQKSNCKSLERIKQLLQINGIFLQQYSIDLESKYQSSLNINEVHQDRNLIIEPKQKFDIKDNIEYDFSDISTFQSSHNQDEKSIYKTLNGVYIPQDPERFLRDDVEQIQKETIDDKHEEPPIQQSEQKKDQQQSLLQKDNENQQNIDFIVYEDPMSWTNQDNQDVEVFQFNEDQQTIGSKTSIQTSQNNEIQNSEQTSSILQSNNDNQEKQNQILQLQDTSELILQNQQDGMIIEQQAKVEEIILDDQDNSQAKNIQVDQIESQQDSQSFNGQEQQQQQQQLVFSNQNNQQDSNLHQKPKEQNQLLGDIKNENTFYQSHKKQQQEPDDYSDYDVYTSLYSDYDNDYDYHVRRHLSHHQRAPQIKHFHHHSHHISREERDYDDIKQNLNRQSYSGQKLNLRGKQRNYQQDDSTIPIIADRIIIEYNFVNANEKEVKLSENEEKSQKEGEDDDSKEEKNSQQKQQKTNKNTEEAEDEAKESQQVEDQEQQKKNKSQNNSQNKAQNKSQDKNKAEPKSKSQEKPQSQDKEKEKKKEKEKDKQQNKEQPKSKSKAKPQAKQKKEDESQDKEQEQEQENQDQENQEQENEDQENQEQEKNEEKENQDEQGQDQEQENNEEKENAEEKQNEDEKGEEMDEDDQWRGFNSKDKTKKKGKSRGNGNKEEEEDEELYDGNGRYIRNHPYYHHRKNKKLHYPYNYPGRYPGDELFDEDLIWRYRCMNKQNRYSNLENPFSGYPYRHRQVVNSSPFYNGNPQLRLNPYTKQTSTTSCVPWMVRQNYPPNSGYRRYPNLYRGKYQDPEYQLRENWLRQQQQQHSKQQVQRYRDQVGYFNCYGYDDISPYYYQPYERIIEDDPGYYLHNKDIDYPYFYSPYNQTIHQGHNYVNEKHFNSQQESKSFNHRMVQKNVDFEQQENDSCLQVFDQCYFKGKSINLCGEYPVITEGLNGFKVFSYIVPENLEIRFTQSDQNEDNVSNISGSEECLQTPYELIPQLQQ